MKNINFILIDFLIFLGSAKNIMFLKNAVVLKPIVQNLELKFCREFCVL